MRWSYSSHTTMRRCQRLFFFGNVLASHNARDMQRREAYLLKQLQHLSTWQGSIVHTVLATEFLADIRARHPLNVTALTSTAQRIASRQFAFSAAKKYREQGQTKRVAGRDYCALFEHEYGLEISAERVAEVHTTLAKCFEHLAGQQEFLARLYSGSGHVTEQLLNIPFKGGNVAAMPDLVYVGSDGRVVVVDWKIAESETSDYSWQLLVYALAVIQCGRWPKAHAETIDLYEANLLKNQIRSHPVSVQRLRDAEDFIYRSIVEQEALVGHRGLDDLDANEFEVAERPNTCSYCNFSSLCRHQLEDTGCSADVQEVVEEKL